MDRQKGGGGGRRRWHWVGAEHEMTAEQSDITPSSQGGGDSSCNIPGPCRGTPTPTTTLSHPLLPRRRRGAVAAVAVAVAAVAAIAEVVGEAEVPVGAVIAGGERPLPLAGCYLFLFRSPSLSFPHMPPPPCICQYVPAAPLSPRSQRSQLTPPTSRQ